MAKISLLNALLFSKCPKCRRGDIFEYSVFNPAKFAITYQKCPNCDVRYEVEPGFFIGAMYVSYTFTVGIVLISGLVLYHLFNDPAVEVYIFTVLAVIILFLPVIFRYSRVLYLHAFSGIKYRDKSQP